MKNITRIHATAIRNAFNRDEAVIALILVGSTFYLGAAESVSAADQGDLFACVEVSNAAVGIDRLRSTVDQLDGECNRGGVILHFSDLNEVADRQLARCLTA